MTPTSIEILDGLVRVRGPLTLTTVEPLLGDAKHRFDGPEVHVDLSAVTEADSAAVALLLAWMRDAAVGGRRVRFENFPANLKSLIKLYDVGEFIPGA